MGDTASGGQETLSDMGAGEHFQPRRHCQGGVREGETWKNWETLPGVHGRDTHSEMGTLPVGHG